MIIPDGPRVEDTDVLERDLPLYHNEHGWYTFHRGCGWSYPEGSGADARKAIRLPLEVNAARIDHARTCFNR